MPVAPVRSAGSKSELVRPVRVHRERDGIAQRAFSTSQIGTRFAASQVLVDTQALPLTTPTTSDAKLLATIAAMPDASNPLGQFCVYAYASADGTGTPATSSCASASGHANHFKVLFNTSTVAAGVKSIRLELKASGVGTVYFYDPKVQLPN